MTQTETLNLPSIERGAQHPLPIGDALSALTGYAFSTREVRLRGRSERSQVSRFGYRFYDCVPATSGAQFDDIDILVVNGLNGQLGVKELENMRDAAYRAARYGHRASETGRKFWELAPDEVGADPQVGTVGHDLTAAWVECTVTPFVKMARAHKLLHHKWPHLFLAGPRELIHVL